MSSLDWYEVIEATDNSIYQADILTGIQVAEMMSNADPEGAERNVPARAKLVDAVVLTQTCDIDKPAVRNILLAQLHNWSDISNSMGLSGDALLEKQKEVRRGYSFHYVLLQERDDAPKLPWSVVDFRRLFTVPKQLVQRHVDSESVRLRMTPPHREMVSQSFGRYFMRVALEDDLMRFESPM